MAHPSGESLNLLLTALEDLEAQLAECSEAFKLGFGPGPSGKKPVQFCLPKATTVADKTNLSIAPGSKVTRRRLRAQDVRI